MKLEGKTRPSGLRAIEAVGKTEVLAQSEVWDPRVDLLKGDLERMKRWAKQGEYILETAWIGWMDPAYGQAIHGDPQIINKEFSYFLHRRAGRNIDTTPDATGLAEQLLVEFSGAYFDLALIVEVFPEVRGKIHTAEFGDDFQQVLRRAVSQLAWPYYPMVSRARDMKCLIQVWPERRRQIIQALGESQENLAWYVERVRSLESIHHAVSTAADFLIIFPELRLQLEEVLRPRMKEIQSELATMHETLVKDGVGHEYSSFIKNLTILGAESAVLDAQGNLQVRLRPLPLGGKTPTLPVREHV